MTMRQEVEKFKEWAVKYPVEKRSGEWECDYTSWDTLYNATREFLASFSPSDWDDTDVSDLLYVIARDNEAEILAAEVARDTNRLLRLSKLALASPETDAKWLLADQLGYLCSQEQEAEVLLLEFVDDRDEYVSRRALLSLGRLKSPKAEALAERAWDTGHEYQRIAALWVLKELSSNKLPVYIKKAFEDGREYVVQNAHQVQQA